MMSAEYKEKLIEQITRLCEKQYRKGYQHGFHDAKENNTTIQTVDSWRFQGMEEDYRNSIDPLSGRKYKSAEKIIAELMMEDMEELDSLINRLDD